MTKLAITPTPCSHCPFRKDVPIYLRLDRREEIADSLFDGFDFPCHATVKQMEDADGEDWQDTSDSKTCAGAAKALMAAGGTTQLMRISERLGMADLDRTAARGAEVWDLCDWVRLAEGSTGEAPEWEVGDEDGVNTCNTVGPYCTAPAGYMTGSGAAKHGTDEAELECPSCGDFVCEECADDEGVCGNCRAWDEDEECA